MTRREALRRLIDYASDQVLAILIQLVNRRVLAEARRSLEDALLL